MVLALTGSSLIFILDFLVKWRCHQSVYSVISR